MKTISLSSVRGGAGVTSVAAMLGEVLSRSGKPVCLIDMNPDDLLRLHFDIPLLDDDVWDDERVVSLFWERQAFQINSNLTVLPFGTRIADEFEEEPLSPGFWIAALNHLQHVFSWVIFDMPVEALWYRSLHQRCDVRLLVVEPDVSSHVILSRSPLLPDSYLLLNKWDPDHQLESDIVTDWRSRYDERLVPVHIFRDENIHEALAHKQPVTRWSPDSIGAMGASALASWCLGQG